MSRLPGISVVTVTSSAVVVAALDDVASGTLVEASLVLVEVLSALDSVVEAEEAEDVVAGTSVEGVEAAELLLEEDEEDVASAGPVVAAGLVLEEEAVEVLLEAEALVEVWED
jgi:hypothetical protein